jgi:cytosine/creatinine deaminase
MSFDLVLRNARLAGAGGAPSSEGRRVDIGIADGRIAALAPGLATSGEALDLAGRLVSPGLVETHLHLDKTCILERCRAEEGTLEEAVREVAAAKKGFTVEDVYARGQRTLERAILQGTTHIRTHVEIDPVIGFTGLDGIRQLARDYGWAVDSEICVFPQEGLLNYPGTEERLVHALNQGVKVLGAAPYCDADPRGQIDRIFALAREFDVDIDMHLDLGSTPDDMQTEYVCDKTAEYGWGGRVAIGHVTRLSTVERSRFDAIARRLADAGVAVTVLPGTDLYLTGRQHEHSVPRGVVPAHRLLGVGVNCTIATNNVLNPFTPYGDASLIRQANLYANVCQVSRKSDLAECLAMITTRAARLMRLADYGIAVGKSADLVVLDCATEDAAIAELAVPLYVFKRGRRTVTRAPAELHRP